MILKKLLLFLFVLTTLQLSAQNATQGSWSPIYSADLTPVAATNLPDGKILTWSAYDRYINGGDGGGKTFTSLFNPANNSFTTTLTSNTGHDMFCPGTANIGNGEIVITGGSGSLKTTIYNPDNNTFRIAQEMNTPRGYHTTCTLNDGKVFAIGGSWSGGEFNKNAEIWSAATGWMTLQNVDSDNTIRQGAPDHEGIYRDDNHAWVFAVPNGNVFQAGPGTNMHWIGTSGAGSVTNAGNRGSDNYAMNGSAVMYDIGKILTFGGATEYDLESVASSNKTYAIDISNGTTANVTQKGNLNKARTLGNSVVLPDGKVLAIGGMCKAKIFSDDCAVLSTEIYNPSTGNWTELASMQTPRTYHSVALLMKDGRVWVGGGGLCGGCPVNHPDAEIYTPPYLYGSNGQLASRPVINSAPATADYSSNISVNMNSGVQSFVLMKLSSVTHSVNVEQRRIPVTSQSSGGNKYTVNIPNNDWLTPGDYYLYALNSAGVPSVAKTIRIGNNAPPVTSGNQIVANGTYQIESSPSGQHLASPSFDANNVRTINASGGTDQHWEILHQGNNIYTVKNISTGRFMNVTNASCTNGANIVTSTNSTADNSKWIISLEGGNYFFKALHCTSKALDKNSGDSKSSHLWTYSTGNNNQKFKLKLISSSPGTTTNTASLTSPRGNPFIQVEGLFGIENKSNGQQLVSQSATNFNATIANAGSAFNKWNFVHLGNGVHTIKNADTNKYLQVAGGTCEDGSNINSGTNASQDYQKWYVEQKGTNLYLVPTHCLARALDKGSGANQNAKIWNLVTTNNNQIFELISFGGTTTTTPSTTTTTPPTTGSAGFVQINGIYNIKSQSTGQHVIAPSSVGFDVKMANVGTATEDWNFTHLGGGEHTIKNTVTNRFLEVQSGQCFNNANVKTWTSANSDHQKWKIAKQGDNFYLQPVHCTTQALDMKGGNNTSPALFTFDQNNNNQKFDLVSTTTTTTTPPTTSSEGFLQINGTYNVKSKANNQHIIAPSSIDFDVKMANAGTATDVWTFQHLGGGEHTIKNNVTNRFLEVQSAQCFNGANVKTWVSANSNHQKWKVFKEGANFFFLPVHCQTHALDKRGGSNNLPHLWTYDKNNNNQKFELVPVNGSVDVRASSISNLLNATPLFGQKTALEWYINQESDSSIVEFVVQHATDNDIVFSDIETINAKDERGVESYFSTHQSPEVGNNYYQIKIIFLDGRIDYTPHRIVAFEPKPATVILAPNPAQDYIKLDLTNYPDEKIYYFISSLKGEVLVNGLFDENHLDVETINLESIPNGNYIMYTRPEHHREITQQFVIMKDY